MADLLAESMLAAAKLVRVGFPLLHAQLQSLIIRTPDGTIIGVSDPAQALAIVGRAGEYVTRAASAAAVAQLSRDAGVDDPIIVGLPELDEPEAGDVLEIEAEARR